MTARKSSRISSARPRRSARTEPPSFFSDRYRIFIWRAPSLPMRGSRIRRSMHCRWRPSPLPPRSTSSSRFSSPRPIVHPPSISSAHRTGSFRLWQGLRRRCAGVSVRSTRGFARSSTLGGWDRLRALAGHEVFATSDNSTDSTKPRTSRRRARAQAGDALAAAIAAADALRPVDRRADGFGAARGAPRFHSSPRTHPGGRYTMGVASPAGACGCHRCARIAGRRTGPSR